jgi:glycerate kinase
MYSLYITSFWGVIPDMKFVFVPDSFKGTLSSLQVIEILEKAAKQHFEDLQVIKVPIADGGEGTVEALITALGGEYRYAEVTGPIEGMTVRARYGISENRTAIIEMAQASGLPLLNENQRNPLLTTTYGTGELIRAALDEGIREFIIGIGGSATNDGGMGMAQALGIAFMDGVGKNVGFGGRYLSEVRQIVIDGLDPRIRESSITVICDVNNPLTGPRGATYIYGPQKGATEEMLKTLENGMKNYARVIQNQLGIDVDKIPGAGAAGGLGAALTGFLGAVLKPGIDAILEFINFDSLLDDVDLVVTGEGRIDEQSAFGKVPVGVAKHCKTKNVPVVAISGIMGRNAAAVYEYGINSIMTTVNRAMPLEEALANAEELLYDAADRMFRFIKTGMDIKNKA